MPWETLTTEVIYPSRGDDTDELREFLGRVSLGYDPHPDIAVIIRSSSGAIVGTGSLSGRVIKHLAVAPEWQGYDLSAQVLDRLYQAARGMGITKLFAFTTPGLSHILQGLGFKLIEQTEDVALLEYVSIEAVASGEGGIDDYLVSLRSLRRLHVGSRKTSRSAAIVMNANPFTRGHLYLVTAAASECDWVYVLVVTEDRSTFPTETRIRLIKAGVISLPNVTVIPGGDYVISQATFPLYFLRRPERAAYIQAKLDTNIFARRIAPALAINARYVGEEPYCDTTRLYNQAMSEVFQPAGIELRIVPRLCIDGVPVSASAVRRALKQDDWETVAQIVPASTLDFLRSSEAAEIIHRLKVTDSAH